ncbi:protein of unknown function (plasmid) [Aminobacter niigataensis]|nr:protein of unknown function [Aminobacter niigataensis]
MLASSAGTVPAKMFVVASPFDAAWPQFARRSGRAVRTSRFAIAWVHFPLVLKLTFAWLN